MMHRTRIAHAISLTWLGAVVFLASAPLDIHASTFAENLGQRLTFVSPERDTWARISFSGDVGVYAPDRPAIGLLFADDALFMAPRVGLALDAGKGARLRAHAMLRADRGFDPGSERHGDVRFDEYYLQADLFDAARARLRVGKFATAFGGWVERHRAWDNPLISAPAVYEDMVTVTDRSVPASVAEFAARRNAPENKVGWVPIVWGPSYATGASLTAGAGPVDALVEVKNAALSSRPNTWDALDRSAPDRLTVTGRLAWHPSPTWTLGTSWSRGPYLQKDARATLPENSGVDDFDQTTVGLDLTFERHRLQLWSELVRVRFEVPRVGDVEAHSGFIELRYKTVPRVWLAARWNGSWFDRIPGRRESWDRDLQRIDLGVGYRHDAHMQAKLEVSHADQSGGNTNGQYLITAQFSMWF
jgi:hypothetical protein